MVCPLNPAIDIGQIEGGFVQDVGWLTSCRSKAVGEPPLMLGTSVFLAIKDAIASLSDQAVPLLGISLSNLTPEADSLPRQLSLPW